MLSWMHASAVFSLPQFRSTLAPWWLSLVLFQSPSKPLAYASRQLPALATRTATASAEACSEGRNKLDNEIGETPQDAEK